MVEISKILLAMLISAVREWHVHLKSGQKRCSSKSLMLFFGIGCEGRALDDGSHQMPKFCGEKRGG